MTAPTLIRNVKLIIEDPDVSGTWLELKGVTALNHQPSTQRADSTTFDKAGYTTSVVTSRGDTFSTPALRYEDESDGSRDPAQEMIEAAAQQIGQAAKRRFRILRAAATMGADGGETSGGYIEFTGDVEVTQFGGDSNALSTWQMSVVAQEKPTYVDVV